MPWGTIIPAAAAAAIALILLLAMRRPAPPPAAANVISPERTNNMTPERANAIRLELRDRLDRRPFGTELAERVWDTLMRWPIGKGVIVEYHREYCGQGLLRTVDGVMLTHVYDGGTSHGAVATWTDRDAFVDFLARQSDFTCSGWDPSEPLFATDDEFYRDNQRLTRAVLERFLRERG